MFGKTGLEITQGRPPEMF